MELLVNREVEREGGEGEGGEGEGGREGGERICPRLLQPYYALDIMGH